MLRLVLRLLSLLCGIAPVVLGTCPKGDTLNTHERCVHLETTMTSPGTCLTQYTVMPMKAEGDELLLLFLQNAEKISFRNWRDAEVFCTGRNGHLTSVHNQYDNTAIRNLGELTSCKTYWTGGQCASGKCSWTDGTPFDFTAWSPGQPNVTNQCIASAFRRGTWTLTDCSQKKCFVCESPQVMTDCFDYYQAGFTSDGKYTIVMDGVPHNVYCDMMTAGGGWTVFQRRFDGNDSFWDHTWADFKNGFGTEHMRPDSNFWLGNELLHRLTVKDIDVTLRVEMKGDRTPKAPASDGFWWNHYNKFEVGPESTNYTLNRLYIDWKDIQGNASTGWYDLTYSVGAPFSTVDRINDPVPACVTTFKMGGWWLHNCALVSLNGAYEVKDLTSGYGLFWIINGLNYIIHPRETAMMLRPTLTSPARDRQ